MREEKAGRWWWDLILLAAQARESSSTHVREVYLIFRLCYERIR